MRTASGVILAAETVDSLPCGAGGEESLVKSVLGDAVAALEREEGKGSVLHFQVVDLGGSTAHFRFTMMMAMVRAQVAA